MTNFTGQQICGIVIGCYAAYALALVTAYVISPMVGRAFLHGTQPWLALFGV